MTESNTVSNYVRRFQHPRYTGENRCRRCTVVNVVLTAVGAGVIGVASPPAAAAFVVLGLAAIYFRGYLVPGTPTLTKRYLPQDVLAVFGKDDGVAGDVDDVLVTAGAIEETPHDDYVALDDDFREQWLASVETDEAARTRRLRELLDADSVDIDPVDSYYVVVADGEPRLKRESLAALDADLGANVVLAERDSDWEAYDLEKKNGVVTALRSVLDRCPVCGGAVREETATEETCCNEVDRTTRSCRDCESELLAVAE